MKIGEVLVRLGYINKNQLEAIIIEQEEARKNSEYPEPLGSFMIRKGIITEEQLDNALCEYFKSLANDEGEPPYVRETAKIAIKALEKRASEGKLSQETKLTILRRIQDYEEKIAFYEKSIKNLQTLEQKKIVKETIEREEKEIKKMLEKIESLKEDLEKFS
ncbi:MAG: hypothetical protein N2258_08525 [Brevinematales bacterium]|nr:hypothetical protein [Brevinematales bacterium]